MIAKFFNIVLIFSVIYSFVYILNYFYFYEDAMGISAGISLSVYIVLDNMYI